MCVENDVDPEGHQQLSVTLNNPVQISDERWLLSWSSNLSDQTFRVYQDGTLIAQTTDTSILLVVPAGSNPVIDVLDDDTPDAPGASTRRSGHVTLIWPDIADTASYLVEHNDGGGWVELGTVEDDGSSQFQFRTGYLADMTTHQFRITPTGTNGNTGSVVTVSLLMVRHPDPPAVESTWDSGTSTFTVASA